MATGLNDRPKRFAWLRHALNPVDGLIEVTSGLVLMLTLTLTAGAVLNEGDDPSRTLFAVALGTALAGGLAAGVVYALEDLYEDGIARRSLRQIRTASPEAARGMIEDQVCATFGLTLPPPDIGRIAEAAQDSAAQLALPPRRLDRGNLHNVAGTVVFNLIALLPPAVAFQFISDWHVALRVSNALLVGMLFANGWVWGKRTDISPARLGLVLMGIGMLLVAIGAGADQLL